MQPKRKITTSGQQPQQQRGFRNNYKNPFAQPKHKIRLKAAPAPQQQPQLITDVPPGAIFTFLPRIEEYKQPHVDCLISDASEFVSRNWHSWMSDSFFRKNQGGEPVIIRNSCLESACSAYQRFMNAVYAYKAAVGLKRVRGLPTAPPLGTVTQARAGAVWGMSYHPKPLPTPHTHFIGCPIAFAFHGTTSAAISQINCKGFDPTKRSTQAYGPGEYFSRSPHIASQFNREEPQMLVVAIILCPDHVIVPNKDMIVVNNPFVVEAGNANLVSYAVPLGVLVYGDLNCREEFFRCLDPPPPPPPPPPPQLVGSLKHGMYARHKTTRSSPYVVVDEDDESD